MFKFLTSRTDDPGFPNAVVLTNKSSHWLVLDDQGRRIPPKSHAAMDAPSVAASSQISEHVEAGLLVVSVGNQQDVSVKPKRKKRQDKQEQDTPQEPEVHQPQVAEPAPVVTETIQPIQNQDVQPSDTLVAEPEPENWVSSNENIVGLPTTDEI